MGDDRCRSYLFCVSAFLVVGLSILAQVLIVGLFFVQPYFRDCEQPPFSYTSPLQSANCSSDSVTNIPILLPINCSASTTLQRQLCYDSGCGLGNMSCPGKSLRCCCRPIPQVTHVTCGTLGTGNVSYNSSCVYAVCEKTLHSVLLQVYDSSEINNRMKSGLLGLRVQFGHYTLSTDSEGIVLIHDIAEGEYPIFILTNSSGYFHASTLSIGYYSPSEIVYIVYAKVLSTNVITQISNCSISSNNNQTYTTEFSNSIDDLLTLPNNFMYNNSFFIPNIVAFSTSNTTTDFTITCTHDYTLYQYSRNGTWTSSTTDDNTFVISSGDNSVLWSLSNKDLEASYIQYIDPNTYPLFVDRGSVLILTKGWFASRVTTDNNTVLAIPVIHNDSLRIHYTTSQYSYLPLQNVTQLGIISTTYLSNNCTSRVYNLDTLTSPASVSLFVSSTKLPICYLPHNPANNELVTLTAANSDDNSLFLSTLQTDVDSVCLPCPCGSNVTIKGTTDMRINCPSIGTDSTVNSNALRLLECNMKLPT